MHICGSFVLLMSELHQHGVTHTPCCCHGNMDMVTWTAPFLLFCFVLGVILLPVHRIHFATMMLVCAHVKGIKMVPIITYSSIFLSIFYGMIYLVLLYCFIPFMDILL